MQLKYFFIMPAAILILSGCGKENNKPSDISPAAILKPLPECGKNVSVQIIWGELKNVSSITITKSYRGQPPFEADQLEGHQTQYEFTSDGRDVHYWIEIAFKMANHSVQQRYVELEIPDCESREQYQRSHPAYSEPIVATVEI